MEEAFSQAGLALFETMIDLKTVKTKTTQEVETVGHDEKELLYNYLEELLLLFEIRQLVIAQVSVTSISSAAGSFQIRGKAKGESYDPARHVGRVEVKGITYHEMAIERHLGKVVVRFLLDL